MKKKIFILASAMFVAGSILTGCSSPDKKVENADQKVQDAKEDVRDAKKELTQAQQDAALEFQKFKNESNEEINANENRIAEFRLEMKNEKLDARERDEKKIDALEKKNRELKDKLDAYQNDGKSDWKEFKTEFKHDLDGLGQAFKNITVRNTK